MTRPKNRDVPKNSSSPAAAAPSTADLRLKGREGMTVPTGMLRIQRPGHRAPKGFRSLPHPQRYTAAPGDFVGGGLRSWLAVRCTRTAAHRPPGTHSLRSRHSRAAASAPASLPSLTVPRGYASVGRLAGSGASPLSVHGLFRNGPLDAGGGSTRRGDTPGFIVERKRSVPPKGERCVERNRQRAGARSRA